MAGIARPMTTPSLRKLAVWQTVVTMVIAQNGDCVKHCQMLSKGAIGNAKRLFLW